MTPARRELARWAIVECTRPRELSARVQALARAEEVTPRTVWRSMAEVIRGSLDARKEAMRLGGYPPLVTYSAVHLYLPGPAVGQARPRIMGGRAAGSGLTSEWARLRLEAAWIGRRETGPAICAGPFGLRVNVYRPDGKLVKPDLDNVIKLHMDAIVDAGCVLDDRLCRHLAAYVFSGHESVGVILTSCT